MYSRVVILTLAASVTSACWAQEVRRLSVAEYTNKMKAGWIGQMAGVGWGFPTEFRSNGKILPADQMPAWRPETVNQFEQDDLYVEMTFLRTLEKHGLDCSIQQAGIDFANSEYPLWHANKTGRENLRNGISGPGAGHPKFNQHADDIDYQIEADYSGLIAPGMPQVPIEMGEKFGRLMNYGDGVYGGQFVGGMYTEAFFEKDLLKIVEAGLRCIPQESQYAEMVRDVITWHEENPTDWQYAWHKCEEKYHNNPNYVHSLCCGAGGEGHFCIDAKLNGAYILIGLLYGDRDLDQTIIIATRCGQDSDCNPSNAAGILFTTIGFTNLPDRYTSALDTETPFSHTSYNFNSLVAVSTKLARQTVAKSGGRVQQDNNGQEAFIIPVVTPKPSPLEASYDPSPIGDSRFKAEEMAYITHTDKAQETLVTCGEFVKIYDPGVGEDKPWYINDHCFCYGPDNLWRLIGITREEPAHSPSEDNFAHATATKLLQQPWDKQPYALSVAPESPWNEEHLWAPHIIKHDGVYYMYYCAGDPDHTKYKIHLATSPDMKKWTRHPKNPMVMDGFDARDPFLLKAADHWIMYYTANDPPEGGNHIVAYVTSKDLLDWSERRIAFTDPVEGTFGGPTESPFVIQRGEKYYLLIGPRGGYDGTDVFVSDSPYRWDIKNKVGHFPAHAAEVVRDARGDWYVSRCGWGRGGVYLAPLTWLDGQDNPNTNILPPVSSPPKPALQKKR